MTSTTRFDTNSASKKSLNNAVDTSSQPDSTKNSQALGSHPSGMTHAANNVNAKSNAVRASGPALFPTNGTDVYISMRADGTHGNTASGMFFPPSFLAASDQVSFDESLSDWISDGEKREGWMDFDIPLHQLPAQLMEAYRNKEEEAEWPRGKSSGGRGSSSGSVSAASARR